VSKFPTAPANWTEDQMTGLVLHYKYVCGFGDKLHGSVSSEWAAALGTDWVEYFASPFNHKFNVYYSVLAHDRVFKFGSKGNFSGLICGRDNVLSAGNNKINPPWNNQMFETVHQIMRVSMDRRGYILAIIV
jgi:hypothetical protein